MRKGGKNGWWEKKVRAQRWAKSLRELYKDTTKRRGREKRRQQNRGLGRGASGVGFTRGKLKKTVPLFTKTQNKREESFLEEDF